MGRENEARFRELLLDRRQVAVESAVSSDVLRDVDVDVAADDMFDTLRARMSTFVFADHLAPETHDVEFRVPASAWQHVKADWFPRFWQWLRRPAVYRTERVTVRLESWATFPEYRRAYPEELGRVRTWQELREERWPGDDA